MKIQDWISDILSAPTVQDYVDRFYDRLELYSGYEQNRRLINVNFRKNEMKQITMQEAMHAVADGKTVEYRAAHGTIGLINSELQFINFPTQAEYFIKETVKVALFHSKNDDQYLECFTEIDAQGSGVKEFFKQVSDWVEIEVKND